VRCAPPADYKAKATEAAQKLGLEIHPGWQTHEIVNEIFGKKIEPTLIQPDLRHALPKELSPLAKLNAEDPTLIDVFECIIGAWKCARPIPSRTTRSCSAAMFEQQVGEEQQNLDTDFSFRSKRHARPAAWRRH